MDKLEPLIRHKFWIIFGLTLPIVLFAYYSASGKMTDETTSKESALDTALQVTSGDAEPNETYAAGAKVINEKLKQEFDQQVQKLWEYQTERMTWPKPVVPHVPDTYRGEIEEGHRYTYMRLYPGVVERVWKRVQPYVGDPKTNPLLRELVVDWPQKVIINGHAIPHKSFDMAYPAENEEIWDAQEDIWLLELIFDAVVRTNEDAQFVSDAPVRQIDTIQLMGGSGESSVTAAPAAAAGGYGESEGYGDYGGYGDEEYGMMGMMMGGQQRTGVGGTVQIAFNPAEEFGPEVPKESDEASAAGESSAASYGGDYGDYGGYGEEDYGGMMGMMGMGGRDVEMQRYIGPAGYDPFADPYRERGFYMSVIILQDKIPEFFAEMSSSPWPIRIERFHLGPNPYAPKDGVSGGMGNFMAYGSEGMYGDDYGDEGYSDYDGYGMSGFGGGFNEMSSGLGMSMGMGMGMGRGTTASTLKLPEYMRMPNSIAPELRSHPDLVQMDFCGIITMYNPVTSAEVEAVDDGSSSEEYEDELEESPATPEEAQKMAAEEAAAAAAANADGVPAEAGAAQDPAASGETPAGPQNPQAAPDSGSPNEAPAPEAAEPPPATQTDPAAPSQ